MRVVMGLALVGFLLLGLLVVVAAMGAARASRAEERRPTAVLGPGARAGGPAPAQQLRAAPDDGPEPLEGGGRDQVAQARGTG
jgi:hypothetical protein